MRDPENEQPIRMIECPACEGWGYDTSQDMDTCNDPCPLCNGEEQIEETAERRADALHYALEERKRG